jgi:hypothetical protein
MNSSPLLFLLRRRGFALELILTQLCASYAYLGFFLSQRLGLPPWDWLFLAGVTVCFFLGGLVWSTLVGRPLSTHLGWTLPGFRRRAGRWLLGVAVVAGLGYAGLYRALGGEQPWVVVVTANFAAFSANFASYRADPLGRGRMMTVLEVFFGRRGAPYFALGTLWLVLALGGMFVLEGWIQAFPWVFVGGFLLVAGVAWSRLRGRSLWLAAVATPGWLLPGPAAADEGHDDGAGVGADWAWRGGPIEAGRRSVLRAAFFEQQLGAGPLGRALARLSLAPFAGLLAPLLMGIAAGFLFDAQTLGTTLRQVFLEGVGPFAHVLAFMVVLASGMSAQQSGLRLSIAYPIARGGLGSMHAASDLLITAVGLLAGGVVLAGGAVVAAIGSPEGAATMAHPFVLTVMGTTLLFLPLHDLVLLVAGEGYARRRLGDGWTQVFDRQGLRFFGGDVLIAAAAGVAAVALHRLGPEALSIAVIVGLLLHALRYRLTLHAFDRADLVGA